MEKRKKEEEEDRQQHPEAAEIPWGDLLPEILSRVPYRSLCRFKCVSTAWLAGALLRLGRPQTLSGFFCYSQVDVGGGCRSKCLSFLNLSGWGRPPIDDPSLRFVRGYFAVTPVHCCGGILICYCWKAAMSDADYVVCNPATEEIWAVLPVPPNERLKIARLCFDPAMAPRRFKVLLFVQSFGGIQTVEAYSSDTGQWTSMRSEWSPNTILIGDDSGCLFLNGTLHMAAARPLDREWNMIVTVDTEGKTWRTIRMPDGDTHCFIGQLQGRLYATRVANKDGCRLSAWVLEDYASGQWTLKCTASILEMLGRPQRERGEFYTLIAVHPECSLIFLEGGDRLMSYDMDTGKLNVICALEDRHPEKFRPYIPCFAEKPPAAH